MIHETPKKPLNSKGETMVHPDIVDDCANDSFRSLMHAKNYRITYYEQLKKQS